MRLLFTLILACSALMLRAQSTGGPDQYGYTWQASHNLTDNSVVNAGLYQWVDIVSSGTKLTGLGDDNFIGPISMGISFPYYWSTYNQLYIGANGYLMFGTGINIASDNGGFPQLPQPGGSGTPNNFLAPLLTDLTAKDEAGADVPNSGVYYQTINDSFIVTFHNIPFWTDANTQHYQGSNTFQVILDASAKSITYNYQSSTGSVDDNYANFNFITRGIENITGSDGLGMGVKKYPIAGSTILFTYPTNSTYQVKDVSVDWVLSEANRATFLSNSGRNQQIQASVTNSGNVAITSATPVNVNLQVTDYSKETRNNVASLQSSVQITSLAVGETKIVTFPTPIPASLAVGNEQVYRIRAMSTVTGDQVGSNNDQALELVIVDTTKESVLLSYDRFAYLPDDDILHDYVFSGGDDFVSNLKVGVYYEPPFYPCWLRAVELGILVFDNGANDPDTLLGYNIQVLDDDGENGSPGTVLSNVNVADNEVVYEYYVAQDFQEYPNVTPNRVRLPQPVQITSGGVYISYEREYRDATYEQRVMNFLATDRRTASPFSYATYEVASGIWSPFRDRPYTDFCIRAVVSTKQFPTGRAGAMEGITVGQAYPNPTQSVAWLPLELNQTTQVQLSITDLSGRSLYSTDSRTLMAGTHQMALPLHNLSSGLYLYILTTDRGTTTGRIQVAR